MNPSIKKHLLPFSLALVVLLLPIFQGQVSASAELVLHFLDVGYGDAIVLQVPEGGAILVDGGDPRQGPLVAASLKRMGIVWLDFLFITHFHKDHAGGLMPVLEGFVPCSPNSKQIPLGIKPTIFIPLLPEVVEPEVEPVIAEIERCPYRVLRRGESISLSPSVTLDVLHPKALSGNPNEDSLVLKVTHGQITILLAGDVMGQGQEELAEVYSSKLQVNLIKIPHHGSGGAPAFVQAVHPEYAILTIGPNRYGAPEDHVLELYKNTGANLLRTDQVGTITAISDGYSLQVNTEPPR